MMNNKELGQIREQLKKEILDLDHQIFQLETFYIQDTREYGNLLKGFENYIASKTARNQPLNKKQKVQNYERLFSLSSTKSKTSQLYEQLNLADPSTKIVIDSTQITGQKRSRGMGRSSGMNKGGGKTMKQDDGQQEDDQNSMSEDNMYSGGEESVHNKGPKRKKITKSGGKGAIKKA